MCITLVNKRGLIMNTLLVILSMLVGFSAAISSMPNPEDPNPPRPWPWPWPPGPWVISKLAGILGGVIGGGLFSQAFLQETTTLAMTAIGISIGACVGSMIVSELVILGMRSNSFMRSNSPQVQA